MNKLTITLLAIGMSLVSCETKTDECVRACYHVNHCTGHNYICTSCDDLSNRSHLIATHPPLGASKAVHWSEWEVRYCATVLENSSCEELKRMDNSVHYRVFVKLLQN